MGTFAQWPPKVDWGTAPAAPPEPRVPVEPSKKKKSKKTSKDRVRGSRR